MLTKESIANFSKNFSLDSNLFNAGIIKLKLTRSLVR